MSNYISLPAKLPVFVIECNKKQLMIFDIVYFKDIKDFLYENGAVVSDEIIYSIMDWTNDINNHVNGKSKKIIEEVDEIEVTCLIFLEDK